MINPIILLVNQTEGVKDTTGTKLVSLVHTYIVAMVDWMFVLVVYIQVKYFIALISKEKE